MTALPKHDLAETLLFLEGVSVSFDGFKALNDLGLDVARGEMRAIIGPNGAGKTTMMDVITGKTRPNEGRVLFNNIDLTRLDEAEIANLGHWPQISETHRVRKPQRMGQSGIGTEGQSFTLGLIALEAEGR